MSTDKIYNDAEARIDELMILARARDEALYQWLGNCSPEERELTVRWLVEGVGAQFMPKPLIRAQEALIAKLNGEETD